MPFKILDTHVHTWNLQRANYPWLQNYSTILRQNWPLEKLEQDRLAAGVEAGILVQAAGCKGDTDYMFEAATAHPWIKGIVAWLPLTNPDETATLLQKVYLKQPLFKGIRHQIHDERDPAWLLQPTVLESLQLLATCHIPFDVVGILPEHISTATQVAQKIPGLRMVLNHLNQPPVASGQLGKWGQLIKEAAYYPNLYAKISGLGAASGKEDWQPADVGLYIAHVLEQFGAERCFCGSDWPVCQLAGGYTKTWETYKRVITGLLDKRATKAVFYDNAALFYGLTKPVTRTEEKWLDYSTG